jgi:sulfur carrier protein ThiS adenylyltransferase
MKIEQIKAVLSTKSVGIAGCGGLGSNCAVALTRVGIGNLVIADFDTVDASNLSRQYYFPDQLGQKKVFALAENLQKINPSLDVKAYDLKLGSDDIIRLFKDCDLIIEAFDGAEMKQMIIEACSEYLAQKPLIIGNGMAGWGKNNLISTEKISENLYVCGDGLSEISDELPPLAPRVGVVAYMQANVALSILLQNKYCN